MEQTCCNYGGVSRRDFLGLTCGCALVAATFGEVFANDDPVCVA